MNGRHNGGRVDDSQAERTKKQLMGWDLVAIGLGVILIGIRYLTYSPPESPVSQSSVAAPVITRHSSASHGTVMVAPPTKPPQSRASIGVTAFGPTFATLRWPMSQDALDYVLYRSTTSNFANAKWIARQPDTTYNDTGLRQDTTYYYWVAAENSVGSSKPLTYARVTTHDSWSTIENQYADSVVKIKTYTSALGEFGDSVYGTGWISPGGYIVTNWHVIHDWNWVIDVYDQAGNKYHAKIVEEDESHHLALLQFVGPAPGLSPLPIGGAVQQGVPLRSTDIPAGKR